MSAQNQNVIKLYQILQQLNDLEMTALRQGGDYDGLIILNRHVLANLIDDFQTALDGLFNVSGSQLEASPAAISSVDDQQPKEDDVPLPGLDDESGDSMTDVQPQIVAGGLGAAPAGPISLNLADDPAENAGSALASQTAVADAQAALDQMTSDSQSIAGSESNSAVADGTENSPATSDADSADNNEDNHDADQAGTDADSQPESPLDPAAALERDRAASDKVIDGSVAAPQPDDQAATNDGAPKLNLDEEDGADDNDDDDSGADAGSAGDDDDAPDDNAGGDEFKLGLLTNGSDDNGTGGADNLDGLFNDNGYNG